MLTTGKTAMSEYSISFCSLHAGPGDVVDDHGSEGGGGEHRDDDEHAEDDRHGDLGDGEHAGDDGEDSEHAVCDGRENVNWIWVQFLSTLQCRDGRIEGGKILWHCEGWPVGQHSQDCQVHLPRQDAGQYQGRGALALWHCEGWPGNIQ